MNTAAVYHRADSEYAFLYGDRDHLRLRLRTAAGDVKKVSLLYGNFVEGSYTHWYDGDGSAMQKYLSSDYFDYWTATIEEPIGHLPAYGFLVEDFSDNQYLYGDRGLVIDSPSARSDVATNYFRLPYMHEIDRVISPEWVKKTIWYQIFPDRFSDGNHDNDSKVTKDWSDNQPSSQDFYGGDLQGIINHLDDLADLGINGIYLTPIFKSPSNHKYNTSDYLEIDPTFGDKNVFKKLVDVVHAHGMKIMLDAVFNHGGDESAQWQDVLRNGQKSIFADWFVIHDFPIHFHEKELAYRPDKNYESFAFTKDMPKWNTANPEVQDYLIGAAAYWTKEFQIDAWRLDVANEVDHHFWRQFRSKIKSINPEVFIVGEIWHSAGPWLNGDQMDSVMNYGLTSDVNHYFVDQDISASQLVSQYNDRLMKYRDQTNEVMFNLLDSHDTMRIKTHAEGNMNLVKSAFAFLFLQPGTPDIYYGSEYGMPGKEDPDCRRPMVWDKQQQDLNMYDFMKRLIALRHDNWQILSEGKIFWDKVPAENRFLAFGRLLGKEKINSFFNGSQKTWSIETHDLTISESNVLIGNRYQIGSDKQLEILSEGFVIMKADHTK
ncbi:MAG: glycoside hydrolase family 13 protein [Oenococcus sp.]|uniref:glycoside hydrolase family 13 protein n=1 Tax=Oenococcus sp. TaxID=1979414 RepID=UPI0039E76001